MESIILFATYFGSALVMLGVFVIVYTWVTPYDDFAMIRENNTAAALVLSGAILGFTFPLLAAVFYTHSLLEMIKWAAITGVVQIAVFTLLRRYAGAIAHGQLAPATVLAATSIAIGMLNAVCISS
jgi:putative membrane protein